MTRIQALVIVVLLWTAIYLPGLGSTEIKGEEGRRILPAIAMLETGEWIVPQISGEPYLSKPPLINWAIAGSFAVTGQRNDWTARLPTVLSVLLLAGVTVWVAGRWMGAEGALVAAVVIMTCVAMIEKGRLAEIEGIYVSLAGVGMVLWISRFRTDPPGSSGWLLWIPPMLFLALAILAKGPLHLLYFYAIVFAVLFQTGQLGRLWSWAHLAGLLLMLGIVALWVLPYLSTTGGGEASATWREQFAGRVTEAKFDAGTWLMTIPRALSDYLPWTLFVPLLFGPTSSKLREIADVKILRGLRAAVTVCFVGLLLIPGILPRYVLPLVVPFAIALGLILKELPSHSRVLSVWRRIVAALSWAVAVFALASPFVAGWSPATIAGPLVLIGVAYGVRYLPSGLAPSLAIRTGILVGMVMVVYTVAAVPVIVAKDNVRPVGLRINESVPDGVTLYAYRTKLFPALVYVRPRIVYVDSLDDLGEDTTRLLVREKDLEKVRERWPNCEVLERLTNKYGKDYVLIGL